MINVIGTKAALLWEKFKETNPILGLFVPLAAIVIPTLGGMIFYKKLHENPIPKYYEYIIGKYLIFNFN